MSSTAEPRTELAQAPAAGALLRAARERTGWSLIDIAAALRIRSAYLEALEDGRVDVLPGDAYAVGFLRTYASALGLDANDVVHRFKSEAALVNRRPQLQFPAPVPERGVPAGALVLLGVLLAIGAYAGWYTLSGDGRLPAEMSVQVPARLAPLAQQAIPPVPPAQPSATSASATPEPPGDTTASLMSASPAPTGTASATAEPKTDAPPVPAVSPTSAAAAVNPLPTPASPAPDDTSRILLRANADAWVQVRDRAGQVLLNRIMHAGETWPVPARPNLLLTTGNAGGTELLVDGAAAPSLGASGFVRRDLPLDPDLIRDGKLTVSSLPAATQTTAVRSTQ